MFLTQWPKWAHRLSPVSMPCRTSGRPARQARFQPLVEALEDRCVPATFTWDGGGGDFNWNNAPNWDLDQLPGSIAGMADVAVIGAAFSGITVTHSGTTSIGSVTSEASLVVAGSGTLFSLASASTMNNAFTLTSFATLTGAGNLTINGTFTWASGTQGGTGTTILGPGAALNIPSGPHTSGGRAIDATAAGAAVNWTGGNFSGSPFSLSGQLNISGTANKLLDGVTITKAGPTTLTGPGVLFVSNGAVFNNLAGAVFDAGDAAFSWNGLGAVPTFNNAGTVRKSAGTGTATFESVFNNSGGVEVQSGTLWMTDGGTQTGSFSMAAATILRWGGTHNVEATATFAGAGFVLLSSGTALLNAPVSVPNLRLSGATLTGANLTMTGTMEWTAGTHSGPGTTILGTGAALNVSGGAHTSGGRAIDATAAGSAVNWTGGGISGSPFSINGQLNISGTSIKELNGVTLNKLGPTTLTGTGELRIDNGAVFNNQVGAVFDAQGNSAIYPFSGVGMFTNAGTFRKSVGTGSTIMGDIVFTNSGTVDVQTGTLIFNGTNYSQTGGSTIVQGILAVSISRIVDIQGGALSGTGTINGTVSNAGQLNPGSSPGRLTINGNYTQTAAGSFNIELNGLTAGTGYDQLRVNGTVSLAGTLNVTVGFPSVIASQFVLIENDGTDAVAGTFSGLPEGSFLSAGGRRFQISYVGGTGNDVTLTQVNTAPVLAPVGNRTVAEKTLLTFTAGATDVDAPPQTLAFSLDPGAPAGASIHATTGVFTWTPTEAQGPGSFPVTIRVTDNGTPALSAAETITITVNEVNEAPILAAIGNKSVNEGSLLTFPATASDADLPANTLTFSLVGAPTGASINSSTGAFSWTPTEVQGPGSFTFTVRVTDNGSPNLFAQEQITVTVNEVNTPPSLTDPGNQAVVVGNTLSFTLQASDPDLPANTLTFMITDGTQPGMTLNATTGTFSWTPTQAGTFDVTFTVTDNGSPAQSASRPITISVSGSTGVLLVAVDIKPGSFPNSINLSSNGVLPVAVLTTPQFNAVNVYYTNLTTIRFGDVSEPARVSPVQAAWDDVNSDGDLDVIFHFRMEDIRAAGALRTTTTQAELTGVTTGGSAFRGFDAVRIVQPLSAPPTPPAPSPDVLIPAGAVALVPYALALWVAAMPYRSLPEIEVVVADLPAGTLGTATVLSPTAGVVTLDVDADGVGWFLDLTPWEHSEFPITLKPTSLRAANAPAAGRFDLLTVLAHELGHVLGLAHSDADDVMGETLPVGVRRLPEASPRAEAAGERRHDDATDPERRPQLVRAFFSQPSAAANAIAALSGSGPDIISGWTAFDAVDTALRFIWAKWHSSRDYPTRVANLRGPGTDPRENAAFFLKASGSGQTVFDDGDSDTLTGEAGQDWFFANLDAGVLGFVIDLGANELLDDPS